MARPKKIWKREDKTDGIIYICPYCRRYVVRASGLQQCAGCGGMVDNDNAELKPANTVIRFDGKGSWR